MHLDRAGPSAPGVHVITQPARSSLQLSSASASRLGSASEPGGGARTLQARSFAQSARATPPDWPAWPPISASTSDPANCPAGPALGSGPGVAVPHPCMPPIRQETRVSDPAGLRPEDRAGFEAVLHLALHTADILSALRADRTGGATRPPAPAGARGRRRDRRHGTGRVPRGSDLSLPEHVRRGDRGRRRGGLAPHSCRAHAPGGRPVRRGPARPRLRAPTDRCAGDAGRLTCDRGLDSRPRRSPERAGRPRLALGRRGTRVRRFPTRRPAGASTTGMAAGPCWNTVYCPTCADTSTRIRLCVPRLNL